MRVTEFIKFNAVLREYRRDVTSRNYGQQLMNRIKQGNIPNSRYYIGADGKPLNTDQDYLDSLFKYLEAGDPTYNPVTKSGGLYMPWIAREFGKGNIRRIEDVLSRVRLTLEQYHQYKNQSDFIRDNPLIKDISRVDWRTLEEYVNNYKPKFSQKETGIYDKVYEDDIVIVIVPKNLQASRFWANYGGHKAAWCTTFPDKFTEYTSQGPLYILIPKNPIRATEKYQLHFVDDGQFMDEEDDPINISKIFKNRFPQLISVFEKLGYSLKDQLELIPDETLHELYRAGTRLILKHFSDQLVDTDEVSLETYREQLDDWFTAYTTARQIRIVIDQHNRQYNSSMNTVYDLKYVYEAILYETFRDYADHNRRYPRDRWPLYMNSNDIGNISTWIKNSLNFYLATVETGNVVEKIAVDDYVATFN